MNNLNTSTFSH